LQRIKRRTFLTPSRSCYSYSRRGVMILTLHGEFVFRNSIPLTCIAVYDQMNTKKIQLYLHSLMLVTRIGAVNIDFKLVV